MAYARVPRHAHERPFRSKTCGLRPADIVVDASQRDECNRNVAPFKYRAISRWRAPCSPTANLTEVPYGFEAVVVPDTAGVSRRRRRVGGRGSDTSLRLDGDRRLERPDKIELGGVQPGAAVLLDR